MTSFSNVRSDTIPSLNKNSLYTKMKFDNENEMTNINYRSYFFPTNFYSGGWRIKKRIKTQIYFIHIWSLYQWTISVLFVLVQKWICEWKWNDKYQLSQLLFSTLICTTSQIIKRIKTLVLMYFIHFWSLTM
jgi:hypothetical protein